MRFSLRGLRLTLMAAVGVAAVAAAAACGDGEGGPETPGVGETPGGPPVERNAYLTGMVEDIKTTNFWSFFGPDITVYTAYVLSYTSGSLFGYSEQRWDWVPILAADSPPDVIQEGELWTTTVTIQDGATWTDGRPITADDAVFTWHTVRDLQITDGNWPSFINLDFFDHAEAVDAATLKIFFKSQPGLAIWQFGLALAPILPKHYWEPVVEQAKGSADPIQTLYAHDGSDAPGFLFSLESREPDAFVSMKMHDNFFLKGQTVKEYENGAYQETGSLREITLYGDATGATSLEFEVGPHVPSVVYNVYADQDSALLSMQEGEFDFWLTPLSLPKGLADQLAATAGITTITNPSNGYRYLAFNFRKPPMDNRAYRTAVGLLIDKEFLCEQILQGQCLPDYAFVPPGNAFWSNPNVPTLGKGLSREERIAEALTVMKDAGFTWDVEPQWDADGNAVNPKGSGLKAPDGTPVPTFRLSAPSQGYDALRATFAIWIGEWLNEFGIPVDVQTFGFNVLADKIFNEQDIDMWILGWGLVPFANHLADFFDCAAAELGGNNAGGFCTNEFQNMVDQFRAETDLAKAREQVFAQQLYLSEQLPYVLLFDTPIVEPYRSAAIEYPYTEEVDGLQGVHYGIPYAVKTIQ